MSTGNVILVTGANQGIGFAIIQALAQHSSEHTLLLACRDETMATQAIKRLRDELGLKAAFHSVTLDVTDDDSIMAAVTIVEEQFGKLDVLINNAGIATAASEDPSTFRSAWTNTLDTNVTSVALVSTLFLPILQKSQDPRIINISSARASFALVTSGANPSTQNLAYSVSKAALNLLTVGMSKANQNVTISAVSPGHCKTAFNGYRGAKDPLDGAQAAVELAVAEKGQFTSGGFWQYEEGMMEKVGW